jgi:hypothetical protein
LGYLDGLQINHRLSADWNWGIFGGFRPGWKNSALQTDNKKYGIYADFSSGSYSNYMFNASIAAAGEYHNSTVSREFLYFRSSILKGSLWNLYQSMEIDINRDWRKEKTGRNITLSSLYLSGYLKFSQFWSGQLTYDNRRNYYQYEYISIADSLFDDAFRQGLRLRINFNPDRNIRLFASGGVRKRTSDVNTTYSYSLGFHARRLILRGLSANVRAGVFSNLYTRGQNYSVRLSGQIGPGRHVSLTWGGQFYSLTQEDNRFDNQWIRLDTGFDLPSGMYISLFYEYDFGYDLKGHRFFAELGYRL